MRFNYLITSKYETAGISVHIWIKGAPYSEPPHAMISFLWWDADLLTDNFLPVAVRTSVYAHTEKKLITILLPQFV